MPGTTGLLTAWQAITPVFLGIFHPIQGVPAFMASPHMHAKDCSLDNRQTWCDCVQQREGSHGQS